MPAKKETVALQKQLLNQEQWDEFMGLEGLAVVDVYQKWCGPCAAVVSLFRRLRNEIGDDLLRFAVAEADSIESLEKYRGKCEPCFLLYGTGQLVNVVRGANAPALAKHVPLELKQEHKVLEEASERKVITDPLLAAAQMEEEEAAKAEEMERKRQEEEARKPVPKEVTVVLIKPDAVANGMVDSIIANIEENGFEILTQEDKTLTEEEAREFYKEHEQEEHYESLVTFMASGPSRILVLTRGDTGEGVVSEVRNLIGPKDVEVAKEEAPDSLRAQYGTDKTMNALHGADSAERAARELTFLLPEFSVPIVPGTGPPPAIEKTLALIRPNALRDHKDEILQKIQEAGFEVCLQKMMQLTEEQAKEFYKEQEGTPHFEDLIREMTSGEVLALGLAKESAIQGWRNLIGPTDIDEAKQSAPDSLRAQYSIPDSRINTVHGSDSVETANQELGFFFPKQTTLAVIKPDATEEHKETIIDRIKEAGFNIRVQKDLELTKELAAKLYMEHEGKEFYENLVDHMSSGLSMIMVLSREDAVDGWRTLMGPTDPEYARENAPESLRALLGKDILQNAVHGSSNLEQAKERIERLFPEIEIHPDGNVKESSTDVTRQQSNSVKEEDGQQAAETADAGGDEAPAEGTAEQMEQPAAEEGEQQAEEPAAEGGEQQMEQQAADGAQGEDVGKQEQAGVGDTQAEQGTEEEAKMAPADEQGVADEGGVGEDGAQVNEPQDGAGDSKEDKPKEENEEDAKENNEEEQPEDEEQENAAPASEEQATDQQQDAGEAEKRSEDTPAAETTEEPPAKQTEQAADGEQAQDGEKKQEADQTQEATPPAEGGEEASPAAETEGETKPEEGEETGQKKETAPPAPEDG